MVESLTPTQKLTRYNNGVMLNNPTAMEEIYEDTYWNVVLFGGGKTLWNVGKPTYQLVRHPQATPRRWKQERKLLKDVRSQILMKNPGRLARAKEYRAYKQLRDIGKSLKGPFVTTEGQTAKLVTEIARNPLAGSTTYTKVLGSVKTLQAQEELAGYTQKVAAQRANGSWWRAAKDATGWTKFSTYTKELSASGSKMAPLMKGIRGNALMAAIIAGDEIYNHVIPAYRLSTSAGLKQTAKSAVKVGVGTAAFAGGMWAGAQAGAALGTAVGSVFPGAGNAVGGAAGFLLGLIIGGVSSYYADKAVDAVLGENEVDAAAKEKADQDARVAEEDIQKFNREAERAARIIIEKFYACDGNIEECFDIEDVTILEDVFELETDDDLHYMLFLYDPERFENFARRKFSNFDKVMSDLRKRQQEDIKKLELLSQVKERIEDTQKSFNSGLHLVDSPVKSTPKHMDYRSAGQQLYLTA